MHKTIPHHLNASCKVWAAAVITFFSFSEFDASMMQMDAFCSVCVAVDKSANMAA